LLTPILGVGTLGVALPFFDGENAARRPCALGAEATLRNCLLNTDVGDKGGDMVCFGSSDSEMVKDSPFNESMPSALDCVLVSLRDDRGLAPLLRPVAKGFKFDDVLEPFFSEGGVGSRGKCSVDDESPWDFCEDWVNLKRPFNFCPNWEAEVERERVPEMENVGEFERDVEAVIVLATLCTILRCCALFACSYLL
jgi:hypothetical protein